MEKKNHSRSNNTKKDNYNGLVARAKRKCQEICTRIPQMSTKQSPASEEVRRTTPIGDSTRTLVGD